MEMINFTMKNINRSKLNIYISIFIFLFISCNKSAFKNEDAVCTFQNLISDYTKDGSTDIKNVETFLLFGNPTNDTIKVSLKDIKENYRHVYKKDTFRIDFEALTPICIPPHDSLGLPCISVIGRKFSREDSIFKKGFEVVNIKSKKIISKTSAYDLKQSQDFQLYKKWGRKSNNMTL
ncbi:hypothetical protein CQ022_21615 [Chryseobacterium culicis]|uniref:Uncharacterized protein n=2 Tax=Chryseobacterium culicis TaxID=680127 RepID=A0A2S9CJZ6_CHRCI|nr:hypothetical protein CQ022_21615 [Chryseobacterium culicis]PRB87645.1 hypothetical protein CQ033_21620 [Chryseobacterium culicis]